MKQQFIHAYIKLESLPDKVRLLNGIKSKERLDCTKANLNSYEGLNSFLNPKKQLFFYKTASSDFIEASYKRRAEYCLSNGKLNFSSIYIEDLDYPQFGYGYPNANRLLGNGTVNPLYQYGNDAYLFLVNPDYSTIEVFIVQQGRHLITHYYQQMIDGLLDEEMAILRLQAVAFHTYLGIED